MCASIPCRRRRTTWQHPQHERVCLTWNCMCWTTLTQTDVVKIFCSVNDEWNLQYTAICRDMHLKIAAAVMDAGQSFSVFLTAAGSGCV